VLDTEFDLDAPPDIVGVFVMPPDTFEYSTTLSYRPTLDPLVPPAPEEKVDII
jgi:hypothetical protein